MAIQKGAMQVDRETLTQLGLTEEELQQRLIEAIASGLMGDTAYDEEGVPFPCASEFARRLQDQLTKALDAQVEAIAQEHIIPGVSELIENATLQRTDEWGEKIGESLTFTQYLVQRAEAYLTEPVDYEGKPTHRSDRRQQTRLTYLVDRRLHYRIEAAMKEAVTNANEILAGALAETARIKLQEIAKRLQVRVETR